MSGDGYLPGPGPGPGSGRRRASLTRRFSVLFILTIALIAVLTGLILTRFQADNMLRRDAVVTKEFVQSIVAEADRVHTLGQHSGQSAALARFLQGDTTESTERLDELFNLIGQMPDVIRVNVFGRDGKIAWSSDHRLVGKTFPTNHHLDAAFGGDLIVETGRPSDGKAEYQFFAEGSTSRFVETYVPLWDRGGTRVLGVFEVYKIPSTLFSAIAMGEQLVWMSGIVGGVVLLALLLWIVRNADTVIRRQQSQLFEAEAFATIGEVSSAIAHGFRNPLAAIRSSAEVSMGDDLPDGVRGSLTDIIAESDRLEAWVRQLLIFSRPGSGTIERVTVAKLLRDSIDGFRVQSECRGIRVACGRRDDQAEVEGNGAALGQVFNGLIANAIEAMPSGGELDVEQRVTRDKRYVEIKITDTGPGIAPEQKQMVFQPFVTTKSAGLGLGLALAQRIVERHGGVIDLVRGKPRGTVAKIRLPVAP